MVKVAVIVGSLRRDSLNRKLALALKKLGRKRRLDLRLVDLSDLPHYNQDLWDDPPASVTRLKREVEAADAVMFVSPEYNRAPPGLVKDAIDWGSRPYGKNSWSGKPAAVIGATTGKIGTAVAQSHLRSTLLVLDLAVMGQPEAYIQLPAETVDADHNVTDESMRGFLEKWLDAFGDWIGKVAGIVPEPGQPEGELIAEPAE
jgi:chromate reductase